MDTRRLVIGLAVVALTGGCGRQGEVTRRRSPAVQVTLAPPEIPEPKAAPWTPPESDLPPDFVAAVQFLQGHAMADPRGGKFSQAYVNRLLDWDTVYAMPGVSGFVGAPRF